MTEPSFPSDDLPPETSDDLLPPESREHLEEKQLHEEAASHKGQKTGDGRHGNEVANPERAQVT